MATWYRTWYSVFITNLLFTENWFHEIHCALAELGKVLLCYRGQNSCRANSSVLKYLKVPKYLSPRDSGTRGDFLQ